MSSTLRNHTVRTAISAFALVLAGSMLATGLHASNAVAATHTFFPVAVGESSVAFAVPEVNAETIKSAGIEAEGRYRRLSSALVRRDLQDGRLTVALRKASKVKGRIRLRIETRTSSAPAPLRPSNGKGGNLHPSSPLPPPAKAPTGTDTGGGSEGTPVPPSPSPPAGERPGGASPVSIPAGARYVSASSGSDSNPGTANAPWRTLAKAISSAVAGDVVVLQPGTYGGSGVTTNFSRSGSASAPIVFTSQPGSERAVVLGYARVTGSHLRLDSLVFDGPTGGIVPSTAENPGGEEVQVSIMYGTDVELTNSEIRDNAWHAGVFVSNATDVRILSNYVHDNGSVATGANLDHGVYWCSGSGVLSNNTIEDNVAWGVHLYPTASDVTVSYNTVTGNDKGGVIVARESSGNEIFNNTVANNNLYGIRAYLLTGAGNVARDNLLWNNGQNTYGSGMTFADSVIANPTQMSSSALTSYGAP